MVVAPVTVFVDEAGTPVFREPGPGSKQLPAYIPCAVAVPTLLCDQYLLILPKGSDGSYLTSKDHGFHDEIGVRFLEALLPTEAQVSALQVDPGGPDSIRAFASIEERVARVRRERGLPKIHATHAIYAHFVAYVIAGAVVRCRRIGLGSFVDVVLDFRNDLDEGYKEEIRSTMKAIFKSEGVEVGDIRWEARLGQPLLNLPDIIAGILHRRGTVLSEVNRSGQMLLAAERSDRVLVQDGLKLGQGTR